MGTLNTRSKAKFLASERKVRAFQPPVDGKGHPLMVPEYFGCHVFDIDKSLAIPNETKQVIKEVALSGRHLSEVDAKIVADAVTDWAIKKGATHFCHWFQPLTGATAEKHDAFLDFDKSASPIQKLSASQLMQGEPDASSFPNGGGRSTFEARGYTAWDITSNLFLVESTNGKTLCIPTAFFSYTSEALDIKTPLLRSITALSEHATNFLNLTGSKASHVSASCGAEQEYFLVDRAFYFARPDLVMTGRTLFAAKTSRNQQLDDHYFGTIPERVEAFMQELEVELYKLGIAAKTRHNEVAPGQFELAPIFCDANIAADQNQLTMSVMRQVALRHDFVALLHEKPFPGINGSGKHVNWSMSDNLGENLLTPGDNPHSNYRFLAVVSIICEAVKRHADLLRVSISSAGNDHRLGANEAPPSIISVFLGDTLDGIFEAIRKGATFSPNDQKHLDIATVQLAQLMRDNTDRNRTSPFAFTGNKFEFRAVGSANSIGLPLSMLNAAVADVFEDSNALIKSLLDSGKSVDEALTELTRTWMDSCKAVIFNGDGYSEEWVDEAAKRGLPNFPTTADALTNFKIGKGTDHLIRLGVLTESEIGVRRNTLVERYIMLRTIEMDTLSSLVHQRVLPAAFEYKTHLVQLINAQSNLGTIGVEQQILESLTAELTELVSAVNKINEGLESFRDLDEEATSLKIAHELMPLMERAAASCESLERKIPANIWSLPSTYDMLFVR